MFNNESLRRLHGSRDSENIRNPLYELLSHVKGDGKNVTEITGFTCNRGKEYATTEYIAPKRTLTTTMRAKGYVSPVIPVRTDKPVPKESLMKCMKMSEFGVKKEDFAKIVNMTVNQVGIALDRYTLTENDFMEVLEKSYR